MKLKLLDVSIDNVTLKESIVAIEDWIKSGQQQYVVTPNVEMLVLAQSDNSFKNALSAAGLAIPDSARLGWGLKIQESGFLKRILYCPFFLFPTLMPGNNFPVTTGTDLMEKLIEVSREKGFIIGLLGGKKNVAIRLSERLQGQYPGIDVEFIQENLSVNLAGDHTFFEIQNLIGSKQNQAISDSKEEDFYQNINSRNLDLLFVAFGHIKQEKWIQKNLKKTNIPVMIGVGGAFDYLSGEVSRAPGFMRSVGLEWLFRLILQPWRIFRFGSLVKFIFLVLISPKLKQSDL